MTNLLSAYAITILFVFVMVVFAKIFSKPVKKWQPQKSESHKEDNIKPVLKLLKTKNGYISYYSNEKPLTQEEEQEKRRKEERDRAINLPF